MILEEVKELLNKNEISYQLYGYENEAEYWNHTMLFPYTKNAGSCKLFVIVIQSENGHKDIELQFNTEGDSSRFIDLCFGDFSYEMFGYPEEALQDEIIRIISEITSGKIKIIIANDLKAKRWLGDASFDTNYSGNIKRFQKAMKRIQRKKSFFARILKSQIQYEIYDWNTYQCIVK